MDGSGIYGGYLFFQIYGTYSKTFARGMPNQSIYLLT